MPLPVVVQNRPDVLRVPAVACPVLAFGCAVVGCERIGVCESRAFVALGGKSIDQVAHDRIGHAVPDEDDGELAEEFGDEPSRPAFGQVRTPEIGRSEDEVRSTLRGALHWHGQFWGEVDAEVSFSCFDKPVVEVRCNEARPSFGPRQGE